MDAALPTTFEKYTVRWPRFPTSICEFITEFDRFAPADARLRLLSVLACEWDREYGHLKETSVHWRTCIIPTESLK